MDSKWTEEQLRAINERGRNILVSAGAGSGKTAVMVERVVKLIMEDKVPVSALLVVTFTRAAASEMKERIRKALKDRLSTASMKGDSGEQLWAKEQLDALHSAQISTFHSFAQTVLKTFFYLTDIEPGFRVLDEAEAEVLKEQMMEELFDSEYEEKEDDFIKFLNAYSGEKNDSDARELIAALYRKLEAVPDRFAVLDSMISDLNVSTDEFRKTETFIKLKNYLRSEIDSCLGSCSRAAALLDDAGLTRLGDLIRDDRSYFEEAEAALDSDDTDKAAAVLKRRHFNTIRTKGKEEKELYDDSLKNRVNVYRDDFKARAKSLSAVYYDTLDNMIAAQRMTYEYAVTIERLVRRFDEMYQESKRDINAIDYSDMEHYALDILRHDEASSYYRDTFRYIFIDEYQDTNIMQETIIGRIKRGDNLFMVGDIKQSIYHFRLADPDIFKANYAAYREEEKLNGENAVSVEIDLNRNFRSKTHVIDEINNMFRPLMDGYDSSQALISGIPEGGRLLSAPETHIIDTSAMDETEDEEIAEMRKEELEARETARIIKGILGKEYTDSKTGEIRKVDYRDIVILMRSVKKNADSYRSVFQELGIPLYIYDKAGYFDTIEINVFLSLLSVIDNRHQDIPFIALLRSEIFGFTCSELALIRKLHKDGSFVDAAESCQDDPEAPESLIAKCRNAFMSIKKWQAYAVTLPLPDLIWRLMNETGYYITVGTFPGGAERQANLRLLADRAQDFADRSFGSLYSFIKYIETVKEHSVDIPQATLLSENDNVVRLMTVHHSKGLEFPVVILAGMDNSHGGNKTALVSFDRNEGLGLRVMDPERHIYEDSLISRMIKATDRRYDTEELQRVFYVAVTRARETFYLVGAANYEKIMEGLDTGAGSDTTLLRMSKYLPNIVRVAPDDLKDHAAITDVFKSGRASDGFDEDINEAVRRLDYEYPYKEAGETAAKTTVTRLNETGRSIRGFWQFDESGASGSENEEEDAEKWQPPVFMGESTGTTSARRGTAYHSVMEALDFSRAVKEGIPYIEECKGSLVNRGSFTEDEMRSVDSEKVMAFFRTGLGERAAAAYSQGKLQKEQTFESKIRIGGEDVLVQGVIDCCFEEPDGIVLLDYKTNRIDESRGIENEKERMVSLYRTQLDVYADALTKASGLKVKEKYLYLFALDESVKVE